MHFYAEKYTGLTFCCIVASVSQETNESTALREVEMSVVKKSVGKRNRSKPADDDVEMADA